MKTKIIVLEGPDMVGKSTQIELLLKFLKNNGKKAIAVKSPFPMGISYQIIRWMLKNQTARWFPNLFQIIHYVNKLIFQWFTLPALIRDNDVLIFDRWAPSMFAYGCADNANKHLTNWMLSKTKIPDLTLMFEGNNYPKVVCDSYESDKKYQNIVRFYFQLWSIKHVASVKQINANQPIQQVHQDIIQAIHQFFGDNL